MKKKTVFIFFISTQLILFFFTHQAIAFSDKTFKKNGKPESVEEIFSKISSSFPHVSREYAIELAEAIYLMRQLEREIYLTNEILELREKGEVYKEMPPLVIGELESEEREAIISGAQPTEETVVARRIFEEPGESLLREERSLIKELEERKEIEKITPPLREKDEVYTKEELEIGQTMVTIEREWTVLVPTIGLRRFMVTDPEKLKTEREGDKIIVTATGMGKAFLHLWDSEGRRTIAFNIRQRGYSEIAKSRKRALKEEKMESFKVNYSFDRYRTNSKSKNPDRSYHHTWWHHNLSVNGETPWGWASSKLKYEGEEEGGGAEIKRDLTSWNFNLTGDDFEISLGDTGAYFSDITLPATGFQGARFRNPEKDNINYDLIWGVRGSRMWGYKIGDWNDENYFCGARAQIEPADFIHFNTTAMRALEDGEDVGEYLYAGGVGVNLFDNLLEIETEAARCKNEETDVHNHAYKIDTTVNLKDLDLLLKGVYRDIDPDFMLVSGSSVSRVGNLGYYFDLDYNPLKYLRLGGEYNVFRDRINFNPDDTHVYNQDWRGTFDFNIGPDTRFNYSRWRRKREGQSSPSHGSGEMYSISHNILSLPPPMRYLSLNTQYASSKLRSLGTPSSDYRDKRYGCSMRLNVLKNLYYDLGHTWQHRHMIESGEKGTVGSLTTGLRYSTQILDTPFYASLNVRYRKERDTMDNLPLSSGENVLSGEGEIRYQPSSAVSTYLRVGFNRMRGVLDHTRNRRETHIYGGGQYLFDTSLRWGVGGSMKGFVFKDFNGNGMMDLGEEGIPGIDIYAGKMYSTVTSHEGEFNFRRLKEYEISVIYDTQMLPEGYKPTTANPQKIELERGLISEVYFGVIGIAEIYGRVFNDVNMNGVFDAGDMGVRAVLLTLDDGTVVQTTRGGHYRMESIKPGKTELTMDTITLPFNLMPPAETKRFIELEEGKYYEEDFPLYALRTIIGNVFVDKNRNNKFDTGEKGMGDVEVRVDDNATLTDERGRYFLKKVKGGMQRVEVVIESLPEEYEILGDAFKEVFLVPEGEIKEDINFPLIRK
jgi:hypothetical protein